MKRVTLSVLAAGIACLGATSTYAYDKATVFNAAHHSAAVIVRYAACKPDSFTVPAATPKGPGQATASSNRGGCLITSVNAILNSAPYKVADYTSSGTSYSRFLIRYMNNDTYKVYSDHELQGIWDREASNPQSPRGDWGQEAAADLAACRKGNQDATAALVARITAGAAKLTQAQKDKFESTRKSLEPVPGQSGSIENCKQKTTTIAAWKVDVNKALGTTS